MVFDGLFYLYYMKNVCLSVQLSNYWFIVNIWSPVQYQYDKESFHPGFSQVWGVLSPIETAFQAYLTSDIYLDAVL